MIQLDGKAMPYEAEATLSANGQLDFRGVALDLPDSHQHLRDKIILRNVTVNRTDDGSQLLFKLGVQNLTDQEIDLSFNMLDQTEVETDPVTGNMLRTKQRDGSWGQRY